MDFNCSSYKIVLCGDQRVGKTCIVHRVIHNEFNVNARQTIGADFFSQIINTSVQPVKLHIWDTAGQEKYQAVASIYFRTAALALVVYDVTAVNSIEVVSFWVKKVKEVEPLANIFVAGNKIDLVAVPSPTIEEWCKNQSISHFYCSALRNEGVHTIFNRIAEEVSSRPHQKCVNQKMIEKESSFCLC